MATSPYIIPVFLPHAGCRNRCAFCSQETATGRPPAADAVSSARAQVGEGLAIPHKKRSRTELAFFGANFLGLAPEEIRGLLSLAREYIGRGEADAIRFSTRPDTVTPESMELVSGFPVSIMELGAQSMDDSVLAACRRGHGAAETRRAAVLVKGAGISLGLHLMAGLPGQSRASFLDSVRAVAELSPDFVRVHPCLVLAGSPLAEDFAAGAFSPLALDEAVSQTADAFILFRERGIPVARMGLLLPPGRDPDELVKAGPWHPAFGELVLSRIFLRRARKLLREAPPTAAPQLLVHPRSLSRMLGHRRENLSRLCSELGLSRVEVATDAGLAEFCVRLAP